MKSYRKESNGPLYNYFFKVLSLSQIQSCNYLQPYRIQEIVAWTLFYSHIENKLFMVL